MIGFVAGVIVVGSVMFFDRIKIDDPVGAISVHLVCGIWGTLAVGLFGQMAGFQQFLVQLLGVAAYGLATVASAGLIFGAVKLTMGLRVSEEEEYEGLDLAEHGSHAYDVTTGVVTGVADDLAQLALAGARATAPARSLAVSEG